MSDDSKKNQVAVREEVNLDTMVKDVENMQRLSAQLMKTKHYQTMGEAGIFAIVQKAKSLNIQPLEALNGGLYYVQGKVGMSSEMMACLIRQAGHSITKDPKSNNDNCILHGRRADNGDTWSISFSMDDARRAGLAKNMYDKYPSVMLYNRAMSMLARQLFPDVIKGAGYTHEELMEIKDNRPQAISIPQEDISIVEPTKVLVSPEQANQLLDLLTKCPKDFASNVSKWVTNKCGRFDQLEERDYLAILAKVEKKLSDVELEVSDESINA